MKGSIRAESQPDAIRSALRRVLDGRQFSTSPRASRFLQHVVDAELAGQGDSLKEYVLGVEVFDRSPSFDPRVDSIVRVEAVNLRKRLRAYYRGPGRLDPIVVEVPKGGYRPTFSRRENKVVALKNHDGSMPAVIAVLPFLNLSSDPEQEFWSDGLTEELTSALARTGGLRVVSRTSAFAFKGKSGDVRDIGRQLGADLVVEGSVRRIGATLRITVQLIDTSRGFHLWSDTLDRRVDNASLIEQDVVSAIAQAVALELTQDQRRDASKRHEVSPQAFELYLKARHLIDRMDLTSLAEAMRLLDLALAADAGYPLPLVGLARCHMRWALIGLEPPRNRLMPAKRALQQAIDLDPQLAEAHALMALLLSRHEWRWAEADKHHRRAIFLSPYSAEVHAAYSEHLAALGRFEEALAENRRARDLDCFSPYIAMGYPYILLHARMFEKAEQEYRRIFTEHPALTGLRGGVAFALLGQKRFREALAEFEAVRDGDPGTGQCDVFLASVQALCGERQHAEELLSSLEQRRASQFVRANDFACLHLGLGQISEAVTSFEQAFQNQEDSLMWAKVSFVFDPVREHPCFKALLSKLDFD